MTVLSRWPHQAYALAEIPRLIEAGVRRICLTSPTGGGKGQIMMDLCNWAMSLEWPIVMYHNRVMLTEQMFTRLDDFGLEYGIMASGYEMGSWQGIQVASIQSVHKWWKDKRMNLPDVKLVLVDEIHTETGIRMQEVLDAHEEQGAAVVVVTATPVGIGHLASELVVAGTTSELRKCGALIPAMTYAPAEPDPNAFKGDAEITLQFKDECKEKMMTALCGNVMEYFERLNPKHEPSILFAPDVAGSLWFAHEFFKAGIPAGHIDAERIWINGETMPASKENRARLKEASRTGEITVVCNRFVLREGIDLPHLAYGILACTFGSLTSYLQACGRLLRSFPGMDFVNLADHGGNFWRFGSVNDDRVWNLEEDERHHALRHSDKFKTKGAIEPTPCPKCKKLRMGPGVCQACGFLFKGKQRQVIQLDGSLKMVEGDIYKPRRYSSKPEMEKTWIRCVMRCKNSERTFAQARGLFMYENYGLSPADHYAYMPKEPLGWMRKVKDVITDGQKKFID